MMWWVVTGDLCQTGSAGMPTLWQKGTILCMPQGKMKVGRRALARPALTWCKEQFWFCSDIRWRYVYLSKCRPSQATAGSRKKAPCSILDASIVCQRLCAFCKLRLSPWMLAAREPALFAWVSFRKVVAMICPCQAPACCSWRRGRARVRTGQIWTTEGLLFVRSVQCRCAMRHGLRGLSLCSGLCSAHLCSVTEL